MISTEGYLAARQRAATVDRSDRGRIVVAGQDRRSYLQGLLTNDIAALATGGGCYSAYLTPQGRMITDLFAYELGDVLLVSLPGSTKDAVLAKWDQFIFGEDVRLGDVTGACAQIAVVGPRAPSFINAVAEGLSAERLEDLPEHGNLRTELAGQPATITRVTDIGEPGFDIYVDRPGGAALKSALASHGLVELDAETVDVLRIEAGVPLFGHDMDEETIPLEAGIEGRAISLTKGCYVGQEVIIRVLHRGHGRVARKLVGLVLESGSAPERGAAIRAADREVGRITSGTRSPSLDRPIALGYVHRDFIALGTRLSVGDVAAVVAERPFVRRS